jgi:hypothetical protein
MEWLDKVLFSIFDWGITGRTLLWLLPLYFSIGFVVSKVWYAIELWKYKWNVLRCQDAFHQVKTGEDGVKIPQHLKLEWGQYFESTGLVKPKPEWWIVPFWSLFAPLVIAYYAVIWPIMKICNVFGGLNKWIEAGILTDFDEQLPTRKEIEITEKELGKSELKQLQRESFNLANKPPKTIGPNKT